MSVIYYAHYRSVMDINAARCWKA